jgi:hypothetical protein
MKTRSWLLLTALVMATASMAAAENGNGVSAVELGNETLRFSWRVEGMAGGLMKLLRMFPSSGDGVLEAMPDGHGRLFSEFRATSQQTAEGEHWTYRTELDLSRPGTLRVWDRLVYRGRERARHDELVAEGALDLLAELQMLRRSPPVAPQRQAIWSGGVVYSVLVTPNGRAIREIGGRRIEARHYSIRGVREPGQPYWKSRAEIWLTDDARAVPVEIVLRGRQVRLLLTLVESPGQLRLAEKPVVSGSTPG